MLEECLVKIYHFLGYLRVFFNNTVKFLRVNLNTVIDPNSKFNNKCKDNCKSKVETESKPDSKSKSKPDSKYKSKSKPKNKKPVLRSLRRPEQERLKADKRIGPHNIDIISILFGSLLGDCHAEFRSKGSGTRFTFYQEGSHSAYLIWLHYLISQLGYCSSITPVIQTRLGNKGSIRNIIRFRT